MDLGFGLESGRNGTTHHDRLTMRSAQQGTVDEDVGIHEG